MGKIIEPQVVAAVLIKKDGKYLLVQEKKAEAYGFWNLPAGRMEVGDIQEETAIREAKEETGYDVKLVNKIGVFWTKGSSTPKHVFEAEIIGGQLKYPENEILDVQWFTFEEILAMRDKLRRPWVFEAVSQFENR